MCCNILPHTFLSTECSVLPMHNWGLAGRASCLRPGMAVRPVNRHLIRAPMGSSSLRSLAHARCMSSSSRASYPAHLLTPHLRFLSQRDISRRHGRCCPGSRGHFLSRRLFQRLPPARLPEFCRPHLPQLPQSHQQSSRRPLQHHRPCVPRRVDDGARYRDHRRGGPGVSARDERVDTDVREHGCACQRPAT